MTMQRVAHHRQFRALRIVVSLVAASACAMLLAQPAPAEKWPTIRLPNEVHPFDIAQQVTLNGVSMRLRGFVSSLDPAAAAAAFRQSLGAPLIENMFGNRRMLARAQGAHYISVQIERASSGSRGIVAVTDLESVQASREVTESSAEHWLSRLPVGSRLLSQMESLDGDKLSRHL
ncbi:MAG: hypothetical protein M3Y55_15940, partial [Pseudomonadota bacterium]|nr:hypothetical protein [Pseudomonadota bacterium]